MRIDPRNFLASFVVAAGVLTAAPVCLAEGDYSDGTDVIFSGCDSVHSWGAVGGTRAYSLQSQTCNIGDADLDWGPTSPLLGMNAYQLKDGRLRQIGMSWMKNGTGAFAGAGCAPPCLGPGGSVLGPGCRDIYSAFFNGNQNILGPRSNVNGFTGTYPGPSGGEGDDIYKRLQIAESDLSPSTGLYFVEGHYVAAGDAAAGNALNNASYQRVTVDASFDLTMQGSLFESIPGIFAWQQHGLGADVPDPSVQVVAVDVPNEGRFHVAAKVTDLGGGSWRYDYAVRNHNSHRSGGSFRVPLGAGTVVSNVGFHDIDYHSGEPYDSTDWSNVVSAAAVTWSSPQTFAQNPDSNALRFATMYNFWFTANVAPENGFVTLGLFRPDASGPGSVTAVVSVPAAGGAAAAGRVPDGEGVPGTPLTVAKNGSDLDLAWSTSCLPADDDYAVYEGALGDFTSHFDRVCTTGGSTFATIGPDSGDRYFLVVPLSGGVEGSYGVDSTGTDREQGVSACLTQQATDCP